MFDAQGRLMAASPACEQAFGLSGSAYAGKTLAEAIPDLPQSVRDLHLSTRRGVHQMNEGEAYVDSEGRRRRFHCEYRPYIGPDGELEAYTVNAVEVTELYDARRDAQLNANRLELALDAARVGVLDIDMVGQTIWCSPEVEEILGQTPIFEAPPAQPWPMSHPDDRARLRRHIRRQRPGRKIGPVEFRIIRPCGEIRWVKLHYRVEWADNGPPPRVIALLVDISVRKQQELALTEARSKALTNENRLTLALRSARAGAFEVDYELNTFWCSQGFIDLVGRPLTAEESLDVWPMTHAEDHARVLEQVQAGARRRSQAGAGTTDATILESRVVLPSGEVHWIEVHSYVDAKPNGQPHRRYGLVRSVADRKSQELALTGARLEAQANADRLVLALGAARAGVFEIDFHTESFWCSPEFIKIVGRPLTFVEAARDGWPFVHPEDKSRVDEHVARTFGSKNFNDPMELRFVSTSGEARWVQIRIDARLDENGAMARLVGLIHDIDERKRQELALIDAQQASEAAAEAKSMFLANMSHELRTPMNGVLGVLHLLAREPLTEGGRELLAEAEACGRMLAQLLNDVVDFSKIEAGRLELAPEPMNVADVLGRVVRLLRPQAEAKGVELRSRTDCDDVWISADTVRLQQVLFNLIGNAVKFTERGHVEVRLAVGGRGRGGKRLRIEVQDTGVGISEAAKASLFQRFQQADSSTARRFGGSGLGLAITRALADLMGGSIGCDSVEGEGSTFIFDVPVKAAPPRLAAPAADLAAMDHLKILVVEDNPTNQRVLAAILRSLGASVDIANDGIDGVNAAQTGAFDLILMDVQMPRMDGVEATRRIRALETPQAATPIIGLTANVLEHQRQSYLAAGMDGVVAKPISPAVLVEEIQRVCRGDAKSAVA